MTRLLAVALVIAIGCKSEDEPDPIPDLPVVIDDDIIDPDTLELPTIELIRAFPSVEHAKVEFPSCIYTSPVWSTTAEADDQVVMFTHAGTIAALDPVTGQQRWSLLVPLNDGEAAQLFAPPAVVGERAVVTYHTVALKDGRTAGEIGRGIGEKRLRHLVAVIDMASGVVDEAFPPVVLEGSLPTPDGQSTVDFLPDTALSRPALVHGVPPGQTLGRVYVTFGNARDIQPWHGWAFEIDLDAWLADGADAAISARLVTTPTNDCGPAGSSGSTQRLCGGGLWAPTGPLIIEDGDSYQVVLAPGNGALDLDEELYSNTLMRVGPGLAFDRACDETACADYDQNAPADACIESCQNLFVPRLKPGQNVPQPSEGQCDGLTMFECWGKMDYIGGSTPTRVEVPDGPAVLAYPAKDGAVYLVDEAHFGLMHDRYEAAALCGAEGDPCRWFWAGMIVTQPTLGHVGDLPVLLVPTFMPDRTHPAGVVALSVKMGDDGPRLHPYWTWPHPESVEAHSRFRRHPSLATIAPYGDDQLAFIVDVAKGDSNGTLYALDFETGQLVAKHVVDGPGMRYTRPLVKDDRVYIVSACAEESGPGHLEAYDIVTSR